MLKMIKKFLIKLIHFWQRKTPLCRRLVLFESRGDLADNSYPLFEYLLNINAPYKYVWVVADASKYKNSRKVKYVSQGKTSFAEIWYFAKAKYCFYTHNYCGIDGKKGQKRIYLTHGFSYKDTKGLFFPPDFHTDIVCLSENHKRLEEYINPGSAQKVRILGYPRTDVLVSKNYKLPGELEAKLCGCSKLFVWLPTYRSHNELQHDDSKQDRYDLLSPESLQIINSALVASNSVMVVKFHPAQQLSKVNVRGLSNVLVFSDADFAAKGIRLYDLLARSDALITDFSSVFADYLLCDKPIAFDISDIGIKSDGLRGFVVDDPLQYMPGVHVCDANGIAKFISSVSEGRDDYAQERANQRTALHKYTDGNSTRRILSCFGLID